MTVWKDYTKTTIQPMRPYVPGEDMRGISVSPEDNLEAGGMIAKNPKNVFDQWYVSKEFFKGNYYEVCDGEEVEPKRRG